MCSNRHPGSYFSATPFVSGLGRAPVIPPPTKRHLLRMMNPKILLFLHPRVKICFIPLAKWRTRWRTASEHDSDEHSAHVVPCQTLRGWTGDCSDCTYPYLCRREKVIFVRLLVCYRPRTTRSAAVEPIVCILYAIGLLKRDEMYLLPASA